ncbi:MAG: hypothetical protein JWM34_3118 [Ilumatobacteraceae bacterium]|nr:hypothetical protein [Ilumatobacteraceae bacterium]
MTHDHRFSTNGSNAAAAGSGRTAWQVIEDACNGHVTGELALTTSSAVKTRIYLMNGLVYFAEQDADDSLGNRLVQVGALTQHQLQNGAMKINGVEHLGRVFDRDSTIDRDGVEIAIESITEETLTAIAEEIVHSSRTTMYRHHSSGIHRWYSSQQSAEAEVATNRAPIVTIVPVVERTPATDTAVAAPPAAFEAPVAVPQPTFEQPTFDQPVFEQPVFEQPAALAQPAALQPMFEQPTAPPASSADVHVDDEPAAVETIEDTTPFAGTPMVSLGEMTSLSSLIAEEPTTPTPPAATTGLQPLTSLQPLRPLQPLVSMQPVSPTPPAEVVVPDAAVPQYEPEAFEIPASHADTDDTPTLEVDSSDAPTPDDDPMTAALAALVAQESKPAPAHPEAPIRNNPPIIELATLLSSPSVPVPEPLLLDPEPADIDPFRPIGTSTVNGSDVWADLWASSDQTASDPHGTVEPELRLDDTTPADAPGATATEPAWPVTLDGDFWSTSTPVAEVPGAEVATPEVESDTEVEPEIEPEIAPVTDVIVADIVEPTPDPVEPPSATLPSPWQPPVAFDVAPEIPADLPTPVLPVYTTPPTTRVSAQPLGTRSVLANAAPEIVLDENAPRLPMPGAVPTETPVEASVEAPVEQPVAEAPTAVETPTLTPLASLSPLTPMPSLTPLSQLTPMTGSVTAAGAPASMQQPAPLAPMTPLAPLTSLSAVAPPVPVPAFVPDLVASAPAPVAVPLAYSVQPTPAPDHLIPPLGSTPVPEDVAAAVRRAIAAIEAATLNTGPAPVSFGAMRVTSPGINPSGQVPAIAAPAAPAPALGAPTLAPARLGAVGLDRNSSAPTGIESIPTGSGNIAPLMSLGANNTGRHALVGTDFAPPMGTLADGAPHLPNITVEEPVVANERRGALRRLIDGIRRR